MKLKFSVDDIFFYLLILTKNGGSPDHLDDTLDKTLDKSNSPKLILNFFLLIGVIYTGLLTTILFHLN